MKPVNLMLIASGSGTGAAAIMRAHLCGCIPEIGDIHLVSTKLGAGCLDKATSHGYSAEVVVPGESPLQAIAARREILDRLSRSAEDYEIGLIFLVGCNVVLPYDALFEVWRRPLYNIHPADPVRHGGKGMHDMRVHEHVLNEAIDLIRREKRSLTGGRFYTYPTVHEVTERPDDGPPLLTAAVEIPSALLRGVLDETHDLRAAALKLREIVLPYEWLMLPAAVRMAAMRLDLCSG